MMKNLMCLLIIAVLVSSAQAALLYDRADLAGHQVRKNTANYEAGVLFLTGDVAPTVASLGFIDLGNDSVNLSYTQSPNDGDGLLGEHRVTLWHQATATKVAEVVIPAGTSATLFDGFRWVALETAITLEANTKYIISAQNGSAAGDAYLNELPVPDTANPYFVGSNLPATWGARYVAGAGNMPTAGTNNGTVYGLANISSVPEPATLALLGLGALVLRRRK